MVTARIAPRIETARLVLRAHGPADLDDCAALWSDPAVTQHIAPRPFSREEVWARLLRHAGHWALLGYGFWLVEEKDGGGFVGEVGLAEFERDIAPALTEPEAGWVVAPRHHGRGLAGEAMGAALDWAERARGFSRTCCIIDPGNMPSLAVAARLGYRASGEAIRGERVVIVHRRG